MRKLLYLGFCLVLLAGFGCAITDYGTITDNNQSNSGGAGVQPVIHTAGKAHINETSQIATIWPDGTDELINFVDQKSDGTATLTTYNNFSTGAEPIFHDDLYCNASWNGCSTFTAPDDNAGDIFDGVFNPNCSGARSLSVLLSTGRYYGECGKGITDNRIDALAAMLSTGLRADAFGRTGLKWFIGSHNMTITAKNLDTGLNVNVPLYGSSIEHFMSERGNVAFSWMDHAMLGPAFRNFSNMLQNELYSDGLEINVNVNGINAKFTIAGGKTDIVGQHFMLRSASY